MPYLGILTGEGSFSKIISPKLHSRLEKAVVSLTLPETEVSKFSMSNEINVNGQNILPYPEINEIYFLYTYTEKPANHFDISKNKHRKIQQSTPPFTAHGSVQHIRLGDIVWVFGRHLRVWSWSNIRGDSYLMKQQK